MSAEVTYTDMTSDSYQDIEEMFRMAGDDKSPKELGIQWASLLKSPLMERCSIEIYFDTDARTEVKSFEILNTTISRMGYAISGHERAWVDATAKKIEPYFRVIQLSGIYRPLMIFRNSNVVSIVAWSLSFIVQIFTLNALSNLVHSQSRSDVLKRILGTSRIDSKFDTLATYQLSDETIIQGMIPLVAAVVLFLISLVTFYIALPMLVPRSGILLGLEKRRYENYMNLFKFLVFSLFITGICAAVAVEVVKYAFHLG